MLSKPGQGPGEVFLEAAWAGQAKGHPWGDRDITGYSYSSHCPCLTLPDFGLRFGDGGKWRRGVGLKEG